MWSPEILTRQNNVILGSCVIHWRAGSNVMRGGQGGVRKSAGGKKEQGGWNEQKERNISFTGKQIIKIKRNLSEISPWCSIFSDEIQSFPPEHNCHCLLHFPSLEARMIISNTVISICWNFLNITKRIFKRRPWHCWCPWIAALSCISSMGFDISCREGGLHKYPLQETLPSGFKLSKVEISLAKGWEAIFSAGKTRNWDFGCYTIHLVWYI